MSSTRQLSNLQPSPTSIDPQNSYKFPANAHLLITTPGHIFSWDAIGVHTIFRSSKNGIVAAREAKDGSGVLAVADKQIVVLHDTKRGQERSWGLHTDDDEVRNLAYTSDAKSLFLSTNLTADIQRYSAEQSRLLSPTKAHASPPVALAVSPTGHLMVSASDNPPTVYLSNLTHNSAPIRIEPRASTAPVTVIAFHPERPDIFLLAFADGTAAAFDATRVARNQTGSCWNQESVNSGEICHFAKLHRPTMGSNRTVSIEDAAFLPGYKSRAVTVGRDGKCRLIDFNERGVVLRTWHAQAPVKSVSVHSRSAIRPAPLTTTSKGKSEPSADADNLIAVGRADGIIQLYDSVGLLLEQKVLRGSGNKVISVEWVSGKSPKQIFNTIAARGVESLPELNDTRAEAVRSPTSAMHSASHGSTMQNHKPTKSGGLGLPPGLRKPDIATSESTRATRRFTIHPDEEGTVRHTPLPEGAHQSPVNHGQYLDLFSPVKATGSIIDEGKVRQIASPPRTRPKLSSQTFVKGPESTSTAARVPHTAIAKPRNLGLFPSTDSSHSLVVDAPRITPKTLRSKVAKQTTSRFKSQRNVKMSGALPDPASSSTRDNARILADLRRLSTTESARKHSGTLAGYGTAGSSKNHASSKRKENKLHIFHRPTDHVETDRNSERAMRAYEEVHAKQGWPEDSHQDSSLDGDIWLTSDTEREAAPRQSRKRRPIDRPPARQTSRSRVVSGGTMSTASHHVKASPKHKSKQLPVDGSTDEELLTARTHLTPDGTLSPSSKDMTTLFPRSSSLWPRKHHQSAQKRRRQERALREIPINTVSGRQANNPWARATASKVKPGAPTRDGKTDDLRALEDEGHVPNDGTSVEQPHCSICSPTSNKVHSLEGEVARLRGELLALKATMRQHGLPLPPSLR